MSRGAGLSALDREVTRSRRTQQALVVGFVDVDRLKRVNDAEGHDAGDQVLIEVAGALRNNTRAYDVILRYGGDEFVCAFPSVDLAFAEAWMARVNRELAARPGAPSVTAGFAELGSEDTVSQLVARADAAFYRARHHDRDSREPAGGG